MDLFGGGKGEEDESLGNFESRNCQSRIGGNMKPEELRERTRRFALAVIKLVEGLPHSRVADILGRQLLKSATSVGANYRAACKARSRADFISKITIVEEEADETQYWLELLLYSDITGSSALKEHLKEARELTAIFTASGKTARSSR